MNHYKPANWGKGIHNLFNFMIVLSLLLCQTGFHAMPVMANSTESQDETSSLHSTDRWESASRTRPVKVNGNARQSNHSENPYGATLTCISEDCSNSEPGTTSVQVISAGKTWIIGNPGPPLPHRVHFRIDCDVHEPGCTQVPVYYYEMFSYGWFSYPYVRSINTDFTSGSPDLPLETHYATGNTVDTPCGIPGTIGSCSIGTGGVLAASKINPNEFDPESDDYHMYIDQNTMGLGVANESEGFTWTIIATFDPAVIADFLPEDAVCTTGICPDASQHYVGDPINTHSGVFSEPVNDLAFGTSAGELSFTRTYIASNNAENQAPLGYGWSHNLENHLIFETAPGGKPGFILYQSPEGNTLTFWNMGDGTFLPWSGVTEQLVQNSGTPVTYSIIEPDQTTYLFNETGQVILKTSPEGATWNYFHDANGWLERVEADGGSRFIQLSYNTHGQITGISDHAGRSVSYARDAAYDLVSATDVLNHIWTYEYDSAHQLVRIVDPDSQQVLRNEYAPASAFDPFALDFTKYNFSKYNNDAGEYTTAVEDDGRTFHITGHGSVYTSFAYNITPNTVLEFDYKSDVQGRVHGIGFDTNWYMTTDTWRNMQLWGTVNYGNATYKNYGSYTPDWHHYVIPIGTHYTGQQANLFFYNDDHTAPYDTDSYYRDVRVYESTGVNPIHFLGSALTNFSSQDGTHSMAIEDGGLTLHLTGNTWKKMSVNYTLTGNSVLEFDFKSDAQGEIHAIGFDTDNSLDPIRTFQLYGSDTYGRSDFNDYVNYEPGWRHYLIPIGQYWTGPQIYLYFGNDHDNASPPTATSYFSNVRIYENDQDAVAQYDGEDNLTVELVYNADGTTTYEDALGNSATDTYNNANVLTGIQDALDNDTAYSYDANFLPTAITDPADHTTHMTWSEDGVNLLSISDALNHTTHFSYNAQNNPTSVTDARNHVTSYAYDGILLSSTTDALDNVTSYTYTAAGLVETITDPLDRVTSFTYDSHGQLASMTDPELNTWTYTHDSLGRLIDTIDPLGRVTRNAYDAAGNLVIVIRNYDAARQQNEDDVWNITTQYTHNHRGQQLTVTDTYNHTTTHTYDDAGRLLTTTDPDNNVTTNVYNEAGQLVSTTDALNHTTSYTYDELGRVITVTDALNHHTHTSYNPDGTIATTTDALDKVTSYVYDDLGQLTSVIDPLSNHTHAAYDEVGNIVTTSDARDNVTGYVYDDLNRLTHTTDP